VVGAAVAAGESISVGGEGGCRVVQSSVSRIVSPVTRGRRTCGEGHGLQLCVRAPSAMSSHTWLLELKILIDEHKNRKKDIYRSS